MTLSQKAIEAAANGLHWFWCWICFKMYMALPLSRTHRSLYGRFTLWLLGYAGYYAYSPPAGTEG